MPRASRYLVEGRTYHLTHRCHDRRFLLRFIAEREAYRTWLRVGVRRYKVAVYGCCITRNHTHVIVHAHDVEAVAAVMRLAAGAVGQALNRRKGHEGSVWEHPYQCTMIEDGRHLLNCLRYVDLNMVRAGVVAHPAAWRWCGYDELCGTRKRYCILDLEGLAERLELASVDALRELHRERVADSLLRRTLAREPHWTEGLAVGDAAFVDAAQAAYGGQRTAFQRSLLDASGLESGACVLRENSAAYAATLPRKSRL